MKSLMSHSWTIILDRSSLQSNSIEEHDRLPIRWAIIEDFFHLITKQTIFIELKEFM